jgi:[ribosomal protein S5]-alanine N-acetyltransferase
MTELRIKVRDGIYLSAMRPADKPALLEHLHSKDIYRTTLNIPHPYREADADWWIRKRTEHTERVGKEVSFALRDVAGKLIGAVGADNVEPGVEKAEIGYWLARPYWGQGIMTDGVRAYVGYAFGELKMFRLTAHVFESNTASARVLEKNGFKLEGHLRKHFQKDGEWLDSLFYGLLKEDLPLADRAP